MSNGNQEEQVSRLIELARGLKRYRLAIVCGKASSGKSQIAIATADQLNARYIKLTSELLLQIAQPGFFPTLGAYGPEDLTDWILEEAYKPDASFLVIGITYLFPSSYIIRASAGPCPSLSVGQNRKMLSSAIARSGAVDD